MSDRYFIPVSALLDAAENNLNFTALLGRLGGEVIRRGDLEGFIEAESLIGLVESHAFRNGWDKSDALAILRETGGDLRLRLARLRQKLALSSTKKE